MTSLPRDNNRITVIGGVSSLDGVTVVAPYVDPVTRRLYVDVASISTHFQTDTFTSTNGQTLFTASSTVVYTIYLSINGAIQTPTTDYTVTGNNASLTSGIPSGNAVVWVYINA